MRHKHQIDVSTYLYVQRELESEYSETGFKSVMTEFETDSQWPELVGDELQANSAPTEPVEMSAQNNNLVVGALTSRYTPTLRSPLLQVHTIQSVANVRFA